MSLKENERPVALVTGGNRGLGWEWSKQLAEKKYRVILTARSLDNAIRAVEPLLDDGALIEARYLDVSLESTMQELSREIALDYGRLDVLINNAGINAFSLGDREAVLRTTKLGLLDPEKLLEMMRVNSIGPALIVKHFLPLLIKSGDPKVINISSWLASLKKKNNGGNYGYAASKAALNMMGKAMSFDLAEHGVSCVQVNPGWVSTDMGGAKAPITPEESVKAMIRNVLQRISIRDAGKFYNADGSEHPW